MRVRRQGLRHLPLSIQPTALADLASLALVSREALALCELVVV